MVIERIIMAEAPTTVITRPGQQAPEYRGSDQVVMQRPGQALDQVATPTTTPATTINVPGAPPNPNIPVQIHMPGGPPQPPDAGGPGGPGGPEAPLANPEWETSPEFGRSLVELIIYLETQFPYEERYNAENGPRLERAYAALKKFVEEEQEHRNDRAPFDPWVGHPKVEQQPNETLREAIARAYKEAKERGVAKAAEAAQGQPEIFRDGESLDDYLNFLKSLTTTPDQRDAIKEPLLKYFREADRKGMLKGLNGIFNGLHLAYLNGSMDRETVRLQLYSRAFNEQANQIGQGAYERKMGDREVNPRLRYVWDAYIHWTRQRLEKIIDGEDDGKYEKGEWCPTRVGEDLAGEQTFWEPYAGYPDFYTVTAKTPYQFRLAKESFLRMIKNHALGYDPQELLTNMINFKKILDRQATILADEQKDWPDSPNRVTIEFATELRQEFEAEGFIWGADYHNEVYNREGWKQFMMAMALHEGPQRWTRLIRSGEGLVGAHTYWLDNDKMIELALNAQGSRGQLANSVAQNYFRDTIIKKILPERGMGVVLKDYDPRHHPDNVMNGNDAGTIRTRLERALRLHQTEEHLKLNNYDLDSLADDARDQYLEARKFHRDNQEFIGLHNSKEEFEWLFEGFDLDDYGMVKGDAHIINFQRYGQGFLNAEDYKEWIDTLPSGLRKSVELGRIQIIISEFRQQIRNGQEPLRRGEDLIEQAVKRDRISSKDKRLYEDALSKSQYYFDIAYQMQGGMQEKAYRGGAVLFVDRNHYVQKYREVRKVDDNIKKEEGKSRGLTLEEKRERWDDEEWLGWIIFQHRAGKRLETFTRAERYLYYGLGTINNGGKFVFYREIDQATRTRVEAGNIQLIAPADRKDIRDHIPYHQEIKFVQAGVNWTKMHYADDAPIWQRRDLAAYINSQDADGNYLYPNFRACFRTAVVEVLRNQAIEEFANNGYRAKLNYVDFELDLEKGGFDPDSKKIVIKPIINKQTEKADVKPMTVKVPTGSINAEGKMDVTGSIDKALDWDTATNHWLSLHTTHTYWAYQNNNTHTITWEYVVQQAKDIRDGKLRWEDADIFAGLLLTVDPTLTRVHDFPGDQMNFETVVFDAAVNDSYLGWVKIRDATKDRFLPRDGNHEWMKMGYYTEDLGGEARFAMQLEASVAKMPKRWARRFAGALGKVSPQHVSTMADNIGRKGVGGAISMMADKVKYLSGQPIFSQFGITKGINLVDTDSELWASLVGYVDPKEGSVEGVFEKPTNNNDKLVREYKEIAASIEKYPDKLNEWLYQYLESFGRVHKTIRVIRKMYSDQRNASGALDLSKTDAFLPDGRFNPEIAFDRFSGTSRQIAKVFWDAYVEWLLDTGPGGGVETYPESADFYKLLKEPYLEVKNGGVIKNPNKTLADWLFEKMAR